MRVLLDECVTRYLKRDLIGHEVFTVEEAGFNGLKNGRLLQAMSGRFDVLVTVDQNLRYQQNLGAYALAVVVLKARRSTYLMLKPSYPHCLSSSKP
jgi:hypothetical protein